MNARDQTVLVFGATGQQGGAVAKTLRADGWRVRALVRDPARATAAALAARGVELVRGDWPTRRRSGRRWKGPTACSACSRVRGRARRMA